MKLKFKYVNWRGEDHEYVITPDCRFEWRSGHWELSGDVVTRDGDPREDMGPTRRRSFKLVDMRDIEEVA